MSIIKDEKIRYTSRKISVFDDSAKIFAAFPASICIQGSAIWLVFTAPAPDQGIFEFERPFVDDQTAVTPALLSAILDAAARMGQMASAWVATTQRLGYLI